ncbi:MAG: hypothetical protein LBG58_10060 [Planctomycetaceae bacterium]|nr:hypothetical protein [Planctomycetaceae bacterium]
MEFSTGRLCFAETFSFSLMRRTRQVDAVCGRQLVLPAVWRSDFLPFTFSEFGIIRDSLFIFISLFKFINL